MKVSTFCSHLVNICMSFQNIEIQRMICKSIGSITKYSDNGLFILLVGGTCQGILVRIYSHPARNKDFSMQLTFHTIFNMAKIFIKKKTVGKF